jgi:catechol 2,3-dioxygenase-like lactoylglutathione lyase family enzyme
MLADKDVMATIAVRDMAVARKFYQQTLGFSPAGVEEPGVVTLRSGKTTVLVYESQFAGTNKATSATWGVGDEMDAIVRNLQKAKVPFEHYDLPGLKRDGDVHVAGDFKAAWFKDPDGNILHINNH